MIPGSVSCWSDSGKAPLRSDAERRRQRVTAGVLAIAPRWGEPRMHVQDCHLRLMDG